MEKSVALKPREPRHAVYESAKAARPERWSGETRNWTPVGAVMLNPEREDMAVPQAA